MLPIIAVDFDGTIVDHQYPDIGKPVPFAVDVLLEMQNLGARIILWTMRHDSLKHGPVLTKATDYLDSCGIKLYGVNINPDQSWSASPKAYAHAYIDDAAIGCPLCEENILGGSRPYVDWIKVKELLFPRFFPQPLDTP